ncbi:MAG: porin family protein [Acidobacteriota bacterium]|nr:porin family protein [Acidobacteriota bacterium]
MRTALSVAALALCLSLPASAQDITPAVDVSGGYSFLRHQERDEVGGEATGQNFHGWVASVAGNLTRWLGLVGEVGGNYKTLGFDGTDVSFSVHSFMGGMRFSARPPGHITPFGQFLVGAVRGSVSALGVSGSTTEFGAQGGGGVDFWIRPKFGIRVGADYRRIFPKEEKGLDEFRFYAGVVVGAGQR